jgi:hypothetical protein
MEASSAESAPQPCNYDKRSEDANQRQQLQRYPCSSQALDQDIAKDDNRKD